MASFQLGARVADLEMYRLINVVDASHDHETFVAMGDELNALGINLDCRHLDYGIESASEDFSTPGYEAIEAKIDELHNEKLDQYYELGHQLAAIHYRTQLEDYGTEKARTDIRNADQSLASLNYPPLKTNNQKPMFGTEGPQRIRISVDRMIDFIESSLTQ
jgi:hypothetical protein